MKFVGGVGSASCSLWLEQKKCSYGWTVPPFIIIFREPNTLKDNFQISYLPHILRVHQIFRALGSSRKLRVCLVFLMEDRQGRDCSAIKLSRK